MKPDQVLSLLGIARKSGNVKTGSFQVEESVKGNKAFLVIHAKDASERTKKDLHDMCRYYQVTIREYGTRESLSKSVGREDIVVISITDENLSDAVLKKMDAKPL